MHLYIEGAKRTILGCNAPERIRLEGLGERRKLPQRGPGQSRGQWRRYIEVLEARAPSLGLLSRPCVVTQPAMCFTSILT